LEPIKYEIIKGSIPVDSRFHGNDRLYQLYIISALVCVISSAAKRSREICFE